MSDPRLAAMTALTLERYGRGDPRRTVFTSHATHARLRLQWALVDTGEVATQLYSEPLYDDTLVAAQGRDLYLDTDITADAVRDHFGNRVERMLDGLGKPDMERDEYNSSFALVAEELQLIRLASVIENIAESTIRIRHLGVDWVAGTFLRLAMDTNARTGGVPYQHYPRTSPLLQEDFDRHLSRLARMVDAEREREATDTLPRAPISHDERLLLWEEREFREGWMIRGMRCYSNTV